MSPESTLGVIVGFGVAGIFWTWVAVAIWLRRRRLPYVTGGLALASAFVVVIRLNANSTDYGATDYGATDYDTAKYGAADYTWPGVSAAAPDAFIVRANEQARVDALHRAFAPALEAYRQAHGQYPRTLETAGVQTPQTRYGPLYYYSSGSERPSWYLISFGELSTHGFSADWDSRTQRWSIAE